MRYIDEIYLILDVQPRSWKCLAFVGERERRKEREREREIKASATLAAEFLGEYLVQHARIAKREKKEEEGERGKLKTQVPPSY